MKILNDEDRLDSPPKYIWVTDYEGPGLLLPFSSERVALYKRSSSKMTGDRNVYVEYEYRGDWRE